MCIKQQYGKYNYTRPIRHDITGNISAHNLNRTALFSKLTL